MNDTGNKNRAVESECGPFHLSQLRGAQSIVFTKAPYLLSAASVAGSKEAQGPLGKCFDLTNEDDLFGAETWEEAESNMQKEACVLALGKSHVDPKSVRYLFGGDLLRQGIATSMGVEDLQIPIFGLYGACSTSGEASLMGEIFEISAKKGYRHYFYGSKEETLELLYQKLTSNYPGIQIAGMYSPPFRPMTEEEDKAIIERINETKPDFVWVGLGAPKQKKWMAEHQGKIDGLMLGVGAGFDYYAENIKRAPMWMQKHNLEWVYRLVQDPKRLFKRYWSTNTKFIWNAMIRGK